MSPPDSLWQVDRLIVYTAFVLAVCAEFSRFWVNLSGQAAKDLTRRLTQQEMSISGHRDEALKNYL